MVQFCFLRLWLRIETVSCRLLLWMARIDMDWNLEKLGRLFHVLNTMTTKIRKKYHGKCFLMKFVWYVHTNSTLTGASRVWVNPLNSHLWPLFISYRSSGEKGIKYQANSSCVIMSVILMTTLFYKALILQGEIWCWSLIGLKRLRQ